MVHDDNFTVRLRQGSHRLMQMPPLLALDDFMKRAHDRFVRNGLLFGIHGKGAVRLAESAAGQLPRDPREVSAQFAARGVKPAGIPQQEQERFLSHFLGKFPRSGMPASDEEDAPAMLAVNSGEGLLRTLGERPKKRRLPGSFRG